MAAVSPHPQTAALNLSVKTSQWLLQQQQQQPSSQVLSQRHPTSKPVQRVHPSDHRIMGTSRPMPPSMSPALAQQIVTQDPLELASAAVGIPGLIVSRKQREFTPEELKDLRYWDRRRKNNDAARRSRQKRRLTDVVLETQVMKLARENDTLKAELLAMKEQIGFADSGNKDKSLSLQQQCAQTPKKICQGKMPLETTPVPYDQKPVEFKTSASQIGLYPVTSLHSLDVQPTSSYPPRLPSLPKRTWPLAQSQFANPELYNLGLVHSHLKNSLHALTVEKDRMAHASHVQGRDNTVAREQRVEQAATKLPTSVPSPASPPTTCDPSKTEEKTCSPPSPHSAFAPGVELSKLPHKLRGKMKRPVPPTDDAAEHAGTDGHLHPKMQRLSPGPLVDTATLAAKTNDDDFRCASLIQDGFTPPPSCSSSSSEGNISPFTPGSLFDFQAKGSDYPPKVSDDLSLSEAHERMVQAAHALAALNKGTSEVSSLNDSAANRSQQVFSGDSEKYWDKRRRNNQAAKKCRDAKRLLIDYRAARSAYLEQENDQLRRETSVLQHEVAQLRELVKKRSEAQAVERMSSSQ